MSKMAAYMERQDNNATVERLFAGSITQHRSLSARASY